jgi:hypothetical protein
MLKARQVCLGKIRREFLANSSQEGGNANAKDPKNDEAGATTVGRIAERKLRHRLSVFPIKANL